MKMKRIQKTELIKAFVFGLLLLLTFNTTFAQKEPVEFKTENRKNSLLVYAYNNMSKPLEVTLTISEIKGLQGYRAPITKKVAANGKMLFAKLSYNTQDFSYQLNHSYKTPRNTNKTKRQIAYEQRIVRAKKKDYYLNDFSKINEGIVVFDDGDCGRTALVTNYLIGNNIDFKIINTAKSPKNTRFMWQTIKEKGASLNIKTPVIIVNGVLTHSHEDLNAFLEGLR